MKIGDQKPVAPPVDSPDGPQSPAAPTSGAGFAEQLSEAGGAEQADGPAPLGDLEALAARIERGELTPAEAMDQVVERVLDAQLGTDGPAEVRERARAFVQETLATDPHLQGLLQRLGGDR